MQVQQDKENLNKGNLQPQPQAEEEFHIEDFMFPDLMRPGLGKTCEYCNISKGKSMVFSSMDQYADHWYENHQGFSLYAFDKDLDKFFRQFQQDYKKSLRKLQQRHTLLDPEQAEYIHERRLQKRLLLKNRKPEAEAEAKAKAKV